MKKLNKFILLMSISFTLFTFPLNGVKAQSNNIPSAILEAINKIDLATNNQDIELLKQKISPNFSNEDGLNLDLLTKSLQKQWSQFNNLKYTSVLESGEKNNNQFIAIVNTNIQGDYEVNGKIFKLNSDIKARQYFENNQLVKQEIISEKTEIITGENPPMVTINLPEKARAGQEFDFDVILQEPLGTDIVLGGVSEEKIDPNLYLEPSTIELDALTAGGIFKRVKLPVSDQDHWYSVILIRDGGIRIITQRVDVEG